MRYILSFIFLNLAFSISSQPFFHNGKDEIYSQYKDGRYSQHCVYVVNAPIEQTIKVINELFDGMKTAPTTKLQWAFDGLGDVGAEEDMLLYEKGVSYNPTDSKYLLNLLVIIKNSREMEVKMEGELKSTTGQTGESTLSLALTKKIKMLHDGLITVSAIPYANNKSVIILNSNLKFGWFFNLFFTQKRYRNIIEWRLTQFLKNVRDRIEAATVANAKSNPSKTS